MTVPDQGSVKPSSGIKVFFCLHLPGGQPGNCDCSSLLVKACYQGCQVAALHPSARTTAVCKPLHQPLDCKQISCTNIMILTRGSMSHHWCNGPHCQVHSHLIGPEALCTKQAAGDIREFASWTCSNWKCSALALCVCTTSACLKQLTCQCGALLGLLDLMSLRRSIHGA